MKNATYRRRKADGLCYSKRACERIAYLATYGAPHETRAAIVEFLQAFQTEAANDALATEKTVKDGLTLREGLPE